MSKLCGFGRQYNSNCDAANADFLVSLKTVLKIIDEPATLSQFRKDELQPSQQVRRYHSHQGFVQLKQLKVSPPCPPSKAREPDHISTVLHAYRTSFLKIQQRSKHDSALQTSTMARLYPSFTPTYHNDQYPAIDPPQPHLDCSSKIVLITGAGRNRPSR